MLIEKVLQREVIILCGLPGAGKTTAALKVFPDYYRINQDELGSRQKCIDEMTKALALGKSVIIDRTNINREQRRTWIDVALNHDVSRIRCILLEVSDDECLARIHSRTDHPNIQQDMPIEKKREIIGKFLSNFEMPSLDEGLSEILITRNLIDE